MAKKIVVRSTTDGALDSSNPAKATETPKAPAATTEAASPAKVTKVPTKAAKGVKAPKAAKVTTKAATKKAPVKVIGRTSALADWMRANGINPKVGRAKLRRKGIARVLNDEAIKALKA